MLVTDPQAPAPPRARRATARVVLDGLVVAGLVALLAFPPLAHLAADRLPVAPAPSVVVPPIPSGARNTPIQRLPAGRASDRGDVRAAAVALLGERRARALLAQVSAPTEPTGRYTFPALERIVPAEVDPAAATDLGARLTRPDDPGADMAAYVLFDRAGTCAARLNLLLMLVGEDRHNPPAIAAAQARAAQACPGDPTPAWLPAVYDSMTVPERGLRELQALRKAFPGSGDVWAAEADAYLRVAYVTPPGQAFVIRRLHERALAGYRQAERLGARRADVELGAARALAGLGRPGEAADAHSRGLAGRTLPTPLRAWQVEYLEAAHRFPSAARAAARLESEPFVPEPSGPGLFPRAGGEQPELDAQDARAPLSIGAATLRPASFTFQLIRKGVAPTISALDLSFIPVFRPSPGVTGSERDCPAGARRRDELLAGRPAVARARLPRTFTTFEGVECQTTPATIAALAALELGEPVRGARHRFQDERQNLWRWAGDLAHAERAAREWAATPDILPRIRRGEIEFLRGRVVAPESAALRSARPRRASSRAPRCSPPAAGTRDWPRCSPATTSPRGRDRTIPRPS